MEPALHILDILSIIHANKDRQVQGRIRLQKLSCLLHYANVARFKDLVFEYHHYGPYSRELSELVQQGVSTGLIEEEHTQYDEKVQRFVYKLTSRGDDFLKKNSAMVDRRIERKVTPLNEMSWRSLELASTIVYLKMEEGITEEAAVERALELKPQCAPFKEEAMTVLHNIQEE